MRQQLTFWGDEQAEADACQLAQARQDWRTMGWEPKPGGLCLICALNTHRDNWERVPEAARKTITAGQWIYVYGERARVNALAHTEATVTIEPRNAVSAKDGLRFRLKLWEIGPSWHDGKAE